MMGDEALRVYLPVRLLEGNEEANGRGPVALLRGARHTDPEDLFGQKRLLRCLHVRTGRDPLGRVISFLIRVGIPGVDVLVLRERHAVRVVGPGDLPRQAAPGLELLGVQLRGDIALTPRVVLGGVAVLPAPAAGGGQGGEQEQNEKASHAALRSPAIGGKQYLSKGRCEGEVVDVWN